MTNRWMLAPIVLAIACGEEERARPSEPREEPIAPMVCAGAAHTCALKPDGTVFCWGANLEGQLGDGTRQQRFSPVPVTGLTRARHLACGHDHTCAIRSDGRVTCWGSNDQGQLGAGHTETRIRRVAVRGLRDAVELALGSDFSCARREDGSVSCWGSNDGAGGGRSTPGAIEGLTGVSVIAAGAGHACAIANGSLSCWGNNGYGQLGRGEGAPSEGVAVVAGLSRVRGVALGNGHSCAIHARGVSCWGYDSAGQLGDGQGEQDRSPVPVEVQGLPSSVTALAAGNDYVCARAGDGRVFSWGEGTMLGVEQATHRHTASAIPSLTNVSALAAGARHACALESGGALRCWGHGSSGQLGIGEREVPAPAQVLEDIAQIAGEAPSLASFDATPSDTPPSPQLVVARNYVCGVEPRGRVRCFGQGSSGALGNGTTRVIDADQRSFVHGLSDARQIDAWWKAACAVRAGGELACWGELPVSWDNRELAPSSLPIPVPGVDDVVEVSVGQTVICVRHESGAVSCLGENTTGQLGNASHVASDTFVRVRGLADAVQLAAGYSTVCARRATGAIVCWGYNGHGELGSASGTASNVPVEVPGIAGATDLSVDYYGACAAHEGHVSCWGRNNYGQLGNGRIGDDAGSTTPVTVAGVDDAARIVAFQSTACLVRTNGEAACWGSNNAGQVGQAEDPPVSDVTTPAPVARTTNVAAFGPYVSYAPGMNFTCGLHRDGHVSCAGSTVIRGGGGFMGEGALRGRAPIAAPGFRLGATPP